LKSGLTNNSQNNVQLRQTVSHSYASRWWLFS
jgi:hypothetical protein